MGFGWDNVGPASQTVAHHYISIMLMYLSRGPSAVSMSGQRRKRWVNIKTVLGK